MKKARQDRQTGKALTHQQRPDVPSVGVAGASRRSGTAIRDFTDFERRWTTDKDDDARWEVLKVREGPRLLSTSTKDVLIFLGVPRISASMLRAWVESLENISSRRRWKR